MAKHFVFMLVSYDNRQALPTDVSSQMLELLSRDGFLAQAVSTDTLCQATMTNPDSGKNQIQAQLETECDDLNYIQTHVMQALDGLFIATSGYFAVDAVFVS
jgi:hypothetical protein